MSGNGVVTNSKSVGTYSTKEELNDFKLKASNSTVINTGLSLAGKGLDKRLKRTRYSFKITSRNKPTIDPVNQIQSEKDDTFKNYNPRIIPDEETINRLFNELLNNGTFFWGPAQRNLSSMSAKRKWDLVCKMRVNYDSNDSTVVNASTFEKSNSNFLSQLETLLNAPSQQGRTLYQLEKLLRHSDFCSKFIDENYISVLSKALPLINSKSEYVFLGCFKSLLNNMKARTIILQDEKILRYLIDLLVHSNSSLRIKLQACQLLLLLTYVDADHGYEIIWKYIEPDVDVWMSELQQLISHPDHPKVKNEQKPEWYLQFPKTDQLVHEFISTSLFFVNSILEGFSSIKVKYSIIEKLKKLDIHKLFYILESFDSSIIKEQIKIYRDEEEGVLSRATENGPLLPDLSYGGILTILIEKSKGTPLEQPIGDLFQSLLKILETRTYSESIKLYKALSSLLIYLLNKFQSENTEYETKTVFQESLNQLIDSLQSDGIARRAMNDLKESEEIICNLNRELTQIKEQKQMSKDDIMGQIEEANDMLDDKEKEIELLSIQVKRLTEQLRDEKIKREQYATHQRLDANYGRKLSLFESLKGSTESLTKIPKPQGSRMLYKSKRIDSLSSYLPKDNISTLSVENVKDNSTELGNASDLTLSNNLFGKPDSSFTGLLKSKSLEENDKSDSDKLVNTTNNRIPYLKGHSISSDSNLHFGTFDDLNSSQISLDASSTNNPNPYESTDSIPSVSMTAHSDLSVFINNVSENSIPKIPMSDIKTSSPAAPPLPEILKFSNHSLPQLPPPPPPPLPAILNQSTPCLTSTTSLSSQKSLTQTGTNLASAQPAPPPPPPPLPESFNKQLIGLPTDSPPPPPLPNTLEKGSGLGPTPPPLPSSFIPDALAKPALKLKQIHWDKLENINNTLWQNRHERKDALMDLKMDGIFDEINNKFKLKENPKTVTLKKKSDDKPKLVSFLSRDLAQQFGINLHMFSNLSVEQFIQKTLSCDGDIFNNIPVLEFFSKDDLYNIPASMARKYAPYGQDYSINEAPIKSPEELERADRIFLGLCYNMRHYWQQRSRSLLILSTYEKDYYDLVYKLQKIDDAIQRLRNSEKFKTLLYIIVELGNYMNSKTVEGIKITSLHKLAFIKSTDDNNISFLHFIEKVIRVRYPDVYSFVNDMKVVEDLGNVTLDQVEIECLEYCKRIDTMIYDINEGKLSNPAKLHPDDQILRKVKYKSTRAKTKSELLKDQLKLTNRDLEKIMRYYGDDPKDGETKNKFFKTFVEFSGLFKKCSKENMEKEEMERIYEQRKKMLELRNKKSAEEIDEKKESNESDVVDQLLSKLRGVEKHPQSSRERRSNLKQHQNGSNIGGVDECNKTTSLLSTNAATEFVASKKDTNKPDRETAENANVKLLERTQALLSDIQNI